MRRLIHRGTKSRNVCAPPSFETRSLVGDPSGDLRLVPFHHPTLGPLNTPSQPAGQQRPHDARDNTTPSSRSTTAPTRSRGHESTSKACARAPCSSAARPPRPVCRPPWAAARSPQAAAMPPCSHTDANATHSPRTPPLPARPSYSRRSPRAVLPPEHDAPPPTEAASSVPPSGAAWPQPACIRTTPPNTEPGRPCRWSA